jgi:hypothetical protein
MSYLSTGFSPSGFPLRISATFSALEISAITLMGLPSLPAQFQWGTRCRIGRFLNPLRLVDIVSGLGESAQIHAAEGEPVAGHDSGCGSPR